MLQRLGGSLCIVWVTLSVERCPFFAWIPTLKKSIFATFPPICPPSTNPHHFSLSGASYATGIPHQNPLHFPHSSSLSGGVLRSHTSQSMAHSFPRISSLSGETYGESFKKNIPLFTKIPYHFVQNSACPGVRVGRFFGGGRGEN